MPMPAVSRRKRSGWARQYGCPPRTTRGLAVSSHRPSSKKHATEESTIGLRLQKGVLIMTQTGLRQPEILQNVIDNVMRVEQAWLASSTSTQNRIKLLVEFVFCGLDELGVPRPRVENNEDLGESISGAYNGGAWVLEVNPTCNDWMATGSDRELNLRECLDTVYHETRHHEQYVRVFYRLIWDTQKAMVANNLNNAKSTGKAPEKVLQDTFHLPPDVASYYLRRRLAKFEYTGMELEELNKWYEEIYGKFGGEQQKVMGDLSANSKRATFYSLYRTLFMEDDGWAAGYAAGDSYMKRTLVSRKRQ